MESPEAASEMACPMVLQAACADKQWLLSLPLAPFTYHVLLARATLGSVTSIVRAMTRVRNFLFNLPLRADVGAEGPIQSSSRGSQPLPGTTQYVDYLLRVIVLSTRRSPE